MTNPVPPSPATSARCEDCQSLLPNGLSALLCPVCMLTSAEDSGEVAEDDELGSEMRFGRYTLVSEIDRGGMGIVYRARQVGLQREVALKILPGLGMMTEESQRMFKQEAVSAAALNHPHVVKIIEAGEHKGQLFIAMELIDGVSLSTRLKDGPMDPTLAAQLMRQVADAVAHTHAHGVVHRDLKPSNILITPAGMAILVDFGLAKATGSAAVTQMTLGSPHYMPPERLARNAKSAEVAPMAGDIYGLGSVLYHCLTGLPPHSGDSVAEVLSSMMEREPVRPRMLRRQVPRDLETICLKCLERKPEARYASAAAVRDDLDRFLRDEPTMARPAGNIERLWRWCRRHVALSLLASGLLLAVFIGTSVSLLGWRSASEQARLALKAGEALRRQSYASDVSAAGVSLQQGSLTLAEQLLDRQIPTEGAADLRGLEWYFLKNELRPRYAAQILAHDHIVTGMEWSPDGKTLATISHDGAVRLWHWEAEKQAFTLAAKLKNYRERCCSVAWMPDGQSLLVSSYESGVALIRVADGTELWRVPGRSFSIDKAANRIAISTARVFYYDKPGKVAIYRLKGENPPELEKELAGDFRLVCLSTTGRWLAASTAAQHDAPVQHGVELHDLADSESISLKIPLTSPTQALCLSPGEDQLALVTSTSAHGVLRFSLPSGSPISTSIPATKSTWSLRYSSDGTHVLSGNSDRSLFSINRLTGATSSLPLAHQNEVWCVAEHPTGKWLASGDKDGEVRLHHLPLRPQQRRSIPTKPYIPIVFSVDSKSVYSATDTTTDPQVPTVAIQEKSLRDASEDRSVVGGEPLGCTTTGQRVGFFDHQNLLIFLKDESPKLEKKEFTLDVPPMEKRGRMRSSCLTRNGRYFCMIFNTGLAVQVDLSTMKTHLIVDAFPKNSDAADGLAGSEDGRFVVSADWTHVIVYDLQTKTTRKLPNGRHWARSIDFSPDGKTLATAGISGRIEILSVPDFKLITTLRGHVEEATFTRFSPDGRTLVSSEVGEGLRFWSTDQWRELLHVKVPEIYRFNISPDGQALAVEIRPGVDKATKTRLEILEMPRR